ncbi:hypothetical protein GCM10009613_41290 [Pseudonocardia kongjuensis]|uniref:Type II secretion system protein GspF domain-containing protein n=1 Tax=Pseudonocardia kongjuensis TaxID=102227 RepID=A0ABN1Y1W1_9PSEU
MLSPLSPLSALSALPSPARVVPVLLLLACAVTGLPGCGAGRRLRGLGRGRAGRARRPVPAAAAGYLLAGLGGLVLLGPAGSACAVGAAWFTRRRRAARRRAERAVAAAGELADALARIADEIRTGAHPAAALAGCSQDGPLARGVLEPAAAAARIGEPVPGALRRAATGPAGRDVERMAAAWELADRHGAPLAGLLTQLLDDLRWRIAHGARVRAQLAGPRATAAVLTALPLAGAGLGQLMGIAPLTVLRTGWHGPGLLVLGVLLTICGAAWSDRILRAAVPS